MILCNTASLQSVASSFGLLFICILWIECNVSYSVNTKFGKYLSVLECFQVI